MLFRRTLAVSAVFLLVSSAFGEDCNPTISVPPIFSLRFNSALKFNQSTNVGRLTFRRETWARYFDSQGILRLAAPNVPRIEHHPLLCADESTDTLSDPQCFRRLRGLLIESRRLNLIPFSDDFSQWNLLGVESAPAPGPDSVSTSATRLYLSSVSNAHTLEASGLLDDVASKVIGSRYLTFSLYVQDRHPATAFDTQTPRPPPFRVQLLSKKYGPLVTTGKIDVRSQYVVPGGLRSHIPEGDDDYLNLHSDVEPISSSWSRVWMTFDAGLLPDDMADFTLRIEFLNEPGIDSSIVFWGAQLEPSRAPTSPIYTHGSKAIRAADVVELLPPDGQSTFPWYNNGQGNFVATADRAQASNLRGNLFEVEYVSGDRQSAGDHWGRPFHALYDKANGASTEYLADEWSLIPDGELVNYGFGYLKSGSGDLYLRMALDGGAVVRWLKDVGTGDEQRRKPLPQGPVRIRLGASMVDSEGFWNGHLQTLTYRNQVLSLADQRRSTSLGCRTFPQGAMDWNAELSDSCDVNALPKADSAGDWFLNDKWKLNNTCKAEGHILNHRCKDNVKVEGGYCRFLTTKRSDGAWTTGSAYSVNKARYGYFETAYKNVGIPAKATKTVDGKDVSYKVPALNNAFWLFTIFEGRADPDANDCEMDVNEGHFPDLVQMSLFKHRVYLPKSAGVAGISKKNNPKRWHHWLAETDPTSLSRSDHFYSFAWNRQEMIWFMDNQIVRRSPNYYCHKAAYVYMSSAIVKGESTDTMSSIPTSMEGKNLEFKFIRSYRIPGAIWK